MKKQAMHLGLLKMKNKKILFLVISAFISAFGMYKAFKDLSDALESADISWDEEEDLKNL